MGLPVHGQRRAVRHGAARPPGMEPWAAMALRHGARLATGVRGGERCRPPAVGGMGGVGPLRRRKTKRPNLTFAAHRRTCGSGLRNGPYQSSSTVSRVVRLCFDLGHARVAPSNYAPSQGMPELLHGWSCLQSQPQSTSDLLCGCSRAPGHHSLAGQRAASSMACSTPGLPNSSCRKQRINNSYNGGERSTLEVKGW